MTIIREDRLRAAERKWPDIVPALSAWSDTVRRADWKSIQDVRKTYSHADGVRLRGGQIVTVFNIRGNWFRLLTKIDFPLGVVVVVELLTHAAYDKDKWKDA